MLLFTVIGAGTMMTITQSPPIRAATTVPPSYQLRRVDGPGVEEAGQAAGSVPMAKKSICGICGKGGKLSDEHPPPQCAGNFREVTLHTLDDWLKAEKDLNQMQNPRLRPKGTLWATFCERCNNEVSAGWMSSVVTPCDAAQARAAAQRA